MLFLFVADMAHSRNHTLRLRSEISIWNYVYRQCTARIKITVLMLVTDALVFRRIISHKSLTTGSTGKQLTQGFWEQGKVLKCISKDILNRGGMLHLLWPLQEKNTSFLFLLLISDQTACKYFLIFELCIQDESWSEHSCSKQPPGLVAAQCTFPCDHFESRYAYRNTLLSNKIYLFISTKDSD